jgi:hypothetical protein
MFTSSRGEDFRKRKKGRMMRKEWGAIGGF